MPETAQQRKRGQVSWNEWEGPAKREGAVYAAKAIDAGVAATLSWQGRAVRPHPMPRGERGVRGGASQSSTD